MSYCLYVRKSRADAEAEARGEGETLTRHINTLLALAKQRHLNITQIYREIVSGETIATRPVMQQLLAEVGQGAWEGVLVMEIERLARGDTIDQGIVAQTFKFSDTKIITPTKDYDPNNEFDEEYFEFGLFMSRREYKTINRRLQHGRMISINEGRYVASVPPYGYMREKLADEKGYTLTPHPDEADIVRLIFRLYTVGEPQLNGSRSRFGISRIVRFLNNARISPRKSEHWSTATVQNILTNPVYIGKIRWNWRKRTKKVVNGQIIARRPRSAPDKCIIAEGKHEPIVDIKTFELAQTFMSSNPPRPIGERNTVKNPLSGLIVCTQCGKKMVRRPYNNRKQADTLMCPDTACNNISSPLHLVEKAVLNGLRNWLDSYRLQWADLTVTNNNYDISVKEKAVKRLTSEHETLTKQLDNIHDLLEQGLYSTEQFLQRSKKVSERLEKNNADIQTLKNDIITIKKREQGQKQIIPKIEKLLEVYDTLPTAQSKNDMLKEVLEKITYTKKQKSKRNRPPADFDVILFPIIPRIE